MIIATSLNIALGRCSEIEIIPRMARAGFGGLDFHFIDLLDRIDWMNDSVAAKWTEELASAARGSGLQWVQAHGPLFDPFGITEKDQRCRALCLPAIEACRRLGVPWMVLHPGSVAGAWDKSHRLMVMEKNIAFFRSLLPACEKAGVGIAIENMLLRPVWGRRYCSVPEDLCELIDALNHPLIGACWDTGHARLAQIEQRGGIASLGKRLKCLHLQENDGQDDDHMMPFVNGPRGVDWRGVAGGLKEAGYTGAITFEFRTALQQQPEELFDSAMRQAVAVGQLLGKWAGL